MTKSKRRDEIRARLLATRSYLRRAKQWRKAGTPHVAAWQIGGAAHELGHAMRLIDEMEDEEPDDGR